MSDTKKETKKEEKAESVIPPELYRIYYDRLFPVSLMVKWLSYGDPENLKNRELSFTLLQNGDEIYVRHKSFTTKEELKKALTKDTPCKIDIGAIFTYPPPLRETVSNNGYLPVSKEFVIDIDMDAYDHLRICCKGATICDLCWPFIQGAVKVLDTALREDFGFNHILWVYSGRRGIHCWVCDERARVMANSAREAVVSYLSLSLEKNSLDFAPPLHPALSRAYEFLLPIFEKTCLDEQEYLNSEKQSQEVLDMIPPSERANFEFTKEKGEEKWRELVKSVEKFKNKMKAHNRDHQTVATLLQRVILTQCYPRLDANVSKQINHLLKSPFSVHPKTGRVCVPVDGKNIDKFNPFTVPTIYELENELNKIHADPTTTDKTKAWQKTSIYDSIKFFEEFLKKIEIQNQKKRKREHGVETVTNW